MNGRGRSHRSRQTWAAVAAAAVLSSCTVVHVHGEQGVRTAYYPGVAVIKLAPADQVRVVEVESLGVSAAASQFSVGWSHSWMAAVPPGRCHIIAWRIASEQLTQLRALFGPGTEICDRRGEIR